MIITCKNCLAKFLVPEEAITKIGRNVKCIRCSHIWFVLPEESIKLTTNLKASDIKHDISSLPVPISQKVPGYLKLVTLFFSVLLMISVCLFQTDKISDELGYLRRIINLSNTDSLKIQSLKSDVIDNKTIKLTGTIINDSKTRRYIPDAKIKLLDKSNLLIKDYILKLSKSDNFLAAKQQYEFSVKINFDVELPLYLEFTIGNEFELLFR